MAENEEHCSANGQHWLPQQPSKTSRLDRNNQKWDSLKEEINRLYMAVDYTLPATMDTIEQKFGFTACERKWKCKLKEWGFDKNIPSKDMQILVAKAQKRKREEGKETVFIRGGNEISSERMENFKRRKTTHVMDAVSPSVETPFNITYHTPRANLGEPTMNLRGVDLDNYLARPGFSGPPNENGMASQSVERTDLSPNVQDWQHQSKSNIDGILSELGADALVESRDVLHRQAGDGIDPAREVEEAVVVDTAAAVEETEDNAEPEPTVDNDPPPSSPDPFALADVEFLLLSKIYTLIDAEFKSSNSERKPGTIKLSRLYNTKVMDAIFKDLTKLPVIFPNGPRDYMFYCKMMDKMARIFEEKGCAVGATIALSLLKRGFGKRNSPVTTECACTCTYKLACIFDKKGENSLAESHYRSAFEGFQALEDEGRLLSQKRQNYQLRCELSFARFLQRIGNSDEALNVLTNTFIKSLSRSCEAPATSAQLEKVLSSLENLSKNIDTDGHLTKNLADLRKQVFTRPLFKVAYFDLVKLANAFSCLGRFDDADSIFDFGFPKILRVETWNHKKTRMAICYAEHYQRQNKWVHSLRPIKVAFGSLTLLIRDTKDKMKIRRQSPPPGELAKALNILLENAHSRINASKDTGIRQQLADTNTARENYLFRLFNEHERRRQELLERERKERERAEEDQRERQRRLEKVGLLRETIGDWVLSKDDDISTTWTMGTKTSNKYGVTYSVGSITGISDAVSMGLQLPGIV